MRPWVMFGALWLAFSLSSAADDIPDAAERDALRVEGQTAFYAADYDKMADIYRRLCRAEDGPIDDARWLGHAYQLSGCWAEGAAAYSGVVDRMDAWLEKHPVREELNARPLSDSPWPTANRNGLQERTATLLLTARIQRHYLNDSAAAEKTLERVYAHTPLLNEPLGEIAGTWRDRIAKSISTGQNVLTLDQNHQRAHYARFPLMALHELAHAQQLNGNLSAALKTWERIHWTTRCYLVHGESLQAPALQPLIQALPPTETAAFPAVTILDKAQPAAEFELNDPATLAGAFDVQNHNWAFALAAGKGLEFAALEFTCDIEQLELRYGGHFDCWTLAGTPPVRKGIGGIGWPNDKPIGRDKISQKFSIPPGAGPVLFRAGEWKDKFKVHSVRVEATLRPIKNLGVLLKPPVPGFIFHTEFVPAGVSVTLDGQPYHNNSTSHNLTAGQYTVEYAHPRLTEPRRYKFDFHPGARYALFLNLDSPLQGKLTNLRGMTSYYVPSPNVIRLPDGRWFAAWCGDGVRFAASEDGVTWSDPIETGDTRLFNDNYNTLSPSLYVDKQGTIWVAYFSNQLDIDQLNTGGYRLFLCSSKDGREWSPPRPINMPVSGWPPGNVQLLDAPNDKVWLLYRMHFAEADTPAEFQKFQKWPIAVDDTQESHARNPHATIDVAGRVHLVWDHFAQGLYYACREPDGTWSEPAEIAQPEAQPRRSDPRLFLHEDRIALVYDANQTTYLQRGLLQNGVPTLGPPIKIAAHTARLIGASPPTADGRVLFLTGGDTVWSHATTVEALVKAPAE